MEVSTQASDRPARNSDLKLICIFWKLSVEVTPSAIKSSAMLVDMIINGYCTN
jgi:hypothetical protein